MNVIRIVLAVAKKDFRTAVSYRFGFVATVIASFWGLIAFRFISKLVNSGQFFRQHRCVLQIHCRRSPVRFDT